MTKLYKITVADPSPSMTNTKHQFTGTYQEAVDEAHKLFELHGRTVAVWSGPNGMYYWHRINGYTGEVVDRNTNSGVVFTKQYTEEALEAFRQKGRIRVAMQYATKPTSGWWCYPATVEAVEEAVDLGWALRTSHTQAKWTEAGTAAYERYEE